MENRDHVSERSSPPSRIERRRKVRIQGPVPANVRGVDSGGREFDLETVVEDISSGGLYLRVRAQVDESAPLSVSFSLLADPGGNRPGTHWETHGVVRRVEPQTDGTNGLGIEFTKHRQLWQNGDGPVLYDGLQTD